MTWSWEEIEREWLRGGRVAASQNEVVEAFARVEATFGTGGLEAVLGGVPKMRGAYPVAVIVGVSRWLTSLDGLANREKHLSGVAAGDRAARTETIAVHLLRDNDPAVEIELEPTVQVGSRVRRPDFRARRQDSGWTYVEVTAAETSATGKEVRAALDQLGEVVGAAGSTHFALEYFLSRTPTAAEQALLFERGLQAVDRGGQIEEELPNGFGLLRLNLDAPGQVTTDLPEGEEYTPRTGMAHAQIGPGVARHVAVRIAFTDDRAKEFLDAEARQLPKDSPGLVMMFVDTAWDAWEARLRSRLQPRQHTRVSAIALVRTGVVSTGRGEELQPAVRLISNEHAAHPLPEWIEQKLRALRDT